MTNQPDPSSTPSERSRPGRHLAVIVRVTTREKGFIFARSASNEQEEFFLHLSSVPPSLWPELEPGDAITCRVAETSKGLRGYDVRAATLVEQQDQIAAMEESRGNR